MRIIWTRDQARQLLHIGGRGKPEAIAEAERLANEVLAKDPNHIEGHILMGSVLFAQNKRTKLSRSLNHAVRSIRNESSRI